MNQTDRHDHGIVTAPPSGASPDAAADAIGSDVFAFRLTPQQALMWRQRRERASVYNGAFRWEIVGPLDAAILRKAFAVLVQRHEGLRGRVREVDGHSMLLIAETGEAGFAEHDVSGLAPGEAKSATERLGNDEARQPFDLENGPLIRARLIKLATDAHVLAITIHQIVSDGWSLSVIANDLARIYTALAHGAAPNLAPLAIQLGDYLAWREEQRNSPEMARQVQHWRGRLASYRRLELAPDVSPHAVAVAGSDSDIIGRPLPDAIAEALNARTVAAGGTMFTQSLAACLVALGHATGRRDVAVAVPIANRDQPELEGLVGPTLNTMILGADISEGLSLGDLEARVRAGFEDALSNKDVPLEQLVEERVLPSPPAAICFTCQWALVASGARHQLGGATAGNIPSISQGAIYDLYVFLIRRESGWRLSIEYRPSHYSAARIERLLDDLMRSLQHMGTASETAIADLFPRAEPAAPAPSTEPASTSAAITPVASDGDVDGAEDVFALPASLTQQRFWLLHKASPSNAGLHLSAAVRISGELSYPRLSRSLDHVVSVHEALRTTFQEINGQLLQLVAKPTQVVIERQAVPSGDRAILETAIVDEANRPFDLGHSPGIRARLLEMSRTDHVLVITLHHAVADGQSVGVLQRDLWAAYVALGGDGEQTRLPTAPALQFADYAVWQQQWLASEAAPAQLRYWQSKLAAPLPLAGFPVLAAPGQVSLAASAVETIRLEPELVERLSGLARAEGATLFAATAAAFAVLLAQYRSGTDDVVFGCPNAGRTADTERVIGSFAAPLAIRIALGRDPTLREVLSLTRDTVLEALAHTEYPFDDLYNRLAVRSVGGRTPLFQFHFLYQRAFLQEQTVEGLKIKPHAMPVGSPYELQIAVIERPGETEVKVDFDRSILAPEVAGMALACYREILQSFVSRPETRLSAAPHMALAAVPIARGKAVVRLAAGGPPQGVIEVGLAELYCDILGVATVDRHANFFDLGGQSIAGARLIVEIERRFGRRLDLSLLAVAPTVAGLATKLAGSEAPTSGLLCVKAGDGSSPIFLIHGVGGHILHFLDLVKYAPESQTIYAVMPPNPEAWIDIDFLSLTRSYAEQVLAVQPRGPYRICGYSFGGLIAVELAALLAERGVGRSAVTLIDMWNPIRYRESSLIQKALFAGTKTALQLDRYLHRDDKLVAFGRRLGRRLPQDWLPGSLKSPGTDAAHVVRTDIESQMRELMDTAREYRPRPFPGEITLIRSDAFPEFDVLPSLGWDGLASDGLLITRVRGDHLDILKAPEVMRILDIISRQRAA